MAVTHIVEISVVLVFLPLNGIITPMGHVNKALDRILTLLRNKIRQQGFTQLEVQEELGWGRSYISQLLTKQKSLRVEQVLLMLKVIGVDPASFFAELYPPGFSNRPGEPFSGGTSAASTRGGYYDARKQLRGLIDVLTNQGIITSEELSAAVHDGSPPDDSGEEP